MRNKYKGVPNEELLNTFINEYNRIKPKSFAEFQQLSKGVPSLIVFKNRGIANTWNELLTIINTNINERHLSQEEFIEKVKGILLLYIKKYNKTPSASQFDKFQIVNMNRIRRIFGSWNNFLKECNVKINRDTPCVVEETNDELIQMYKNYCSRIGKIATCTDLDKSTKIYSSKIFIRRFGSIQEVRKLAGLNYELSQNIAFNKNDVFNEMVKLYIKYKGRLKNCELQMECNNSSVLPSITLIPRHMKVNTLNETWNKVESYLALQYCMLVSDK